MILSYIVGEKVGIFKLRCFVIVGVLFLEVKKVVEKCIIDLECFVVWVEFVKLLVES